MIFYDELDGGGNVVRAGFSLGPYDQLPQGHRWVEHVTTLEELKAKRRSEIESWRDMACAQDVNVPVNGVNHLWQANKKSQDLIGTAMSLASLGVIPTPPVWRSSNNEDVSITLQDLKNIAAMIAFKTNEAFTKSWQLKAQLDAATTAAEVEAVIW